MIRAYQFLNKLGIPKSAIRFRQHLENEKAHYANDCWDLEVYTSHGWIEVVGIADRASYDLTQHTKHSNVELLASRPLEHPQEYEEILISCDKPQLAKLLKKDSKVVLEYLEQLTEAQKTEFSAKHAEVVDTVDVTVGEHTFSIPKEIIKVKITKAMRHEEKFVPNVVEPSFGIGRIMQCVLEHNFNVRQDDERRTYFKFTPQIAPYNVCILPLLSNNDDLVAKSYEIRKALIRNEIPCKIETNYSIGKRYSKMDEIGINYSLTVDHQTLNDNTITLRDIETMEQKRVDASTIHKQIHELINTRSD